MRSTLPRPFLLVRFRDVSQVSGTGVVAEGTEWTDGSASLRWRGEYPTTTFFESGVRAIVAVHGPAHRAPAMSYAFMSVAR